MPPTEIARHRSATGELANKTHKYKACSLRMGPKKFRYTPGRTFQPPRLDKESQQWERGRGGAEQLRECELRTSPSLHRIKLSLARLQGAAWPCP